MLELLAEKFVTDPELLNQLKGMMNMGVIAEMIREDAIKDERIKITKKMLKRS